MKTYVRITDIIESELVEVNELLAREYSEIENNKELKEIEIYYILNEKGEVRVIHSTMCNSEGKTEPRIRFMRHEDFNEYYQEVETQ